MALNRTVTVYDREGVEVGFQITKTRNAIEICRVAKFTQFFEDEKSGATYQNPFENKIVTDITTFCHLSAPITDSHGMVTYKPLIELRALNDPTQLVLLLPVDLREIVLLFGENNKKLATIHISDSAIHIIQDKIQQIDPTTLKLALAGKFPKEINPITSEMISTPLTDLHTHYAGILTSEQLLKGIQKKLELNESVNYPVKHLLMAGIGIDDLSIYFKVESFHEFKESFDYDKSTFDLTSMYRPEYRNNPKNIENLAKLKFNLSIPVGKSVIFDNMEEYYVYRDVLVKDIHLFEFFLRELALEYKRQDIEYIEISFSKISDPAWIKIANKVVPMIEKEIGVNIRFLGAIAS